MTPKLQLKHRAKTATDFRQRVNLIRVAHARKKRECEEGKHAKYPR